MLSCRKFDIHRKAIQFSCRPSIYDNEPMMNDSNKMKDFDFFVDKITVENVLRFQKCLKRFGSSLAEDRILIYLKSGP